MQVWVKQREIKRSCACRELAALEARFDALSASSEADVKAAQSAASHAQEELAAMHEAHEKMVADSAAAREASAATARSERNAALKEIKDKHAAEKKQIQVLALAVAVCMSPRGKLVNPPVGVLRIL